MSSSLSSRSPPVDYRIPDALLPLLRRVSSKMSEKFSRPWFELQRSHFYKDDRGIANAQELGSALQHFHVLLSPAELTLLYNSYPLIEQVNSHHYNSKSLSVSRLHTLSSLNSLPILRYQQIGFDFKTLANDLFPMYEGPIGYTKNNGEGELQKQQQQQQQHLRQQQQEQQQQQQSQPLVYVVSQTIQPIAAGTASSGTGGFGGTQPIVNGYVNGNRAAAGKPNLKARNVLKNSTSTSKLGGINSRGSRPTPQTYMNPIDHRSSRALTAAGSGISKNGDSGTIQPVPLFSHYPAQEFKRISGIQRGKPIVFA